jgi:hypothetical protein
VAAQEVRAGRANTCLVESFADTLISVWHQVMADGKTPVVIDGKPYTVGLTRSSRLRTVEFPFRRHRMAGIEQNPETSSRWAALAREGHRIMQFSCDGRYVANVCDGRLTRYPSWRALKLPE